MSSKLTPAQIRTALNRAIFETTQLKHMLHRNIHFLFRCKDISSNGFAAALGLPGTSFDLQITKTLTKSKNKAFRNDPNYYINQANSIDGECSHFTRDSRRKAPRPGPSAFRCT